MKIKYPEIVWRDLFPNTIMSGKHFSAKIGDEYAVVSRSLEGTWGVQIGDAPMWDESGVNFSSEWKAKDAVETHVRKCILIQVKAAQIVLDKYTESDK